MPPQITHPDVESDSGPDEVPAKPSPKPLETEKSEIEPINEDEDEDDDEEREDEFKVEKIIKHGWADDGSVIYMIKWEGYDKLSDRTWEPLKNLEGAPDIVERYHKQIGGAPQPQTSIKVKPKGKKRQSNAHESNAVEVSTKKRKRSTPDTNGLYHKKKLPDGLWENDILRISAVIEEVSDDAAKDKSDHSKLVVLLEWNDGLRTQHPMNVLRRKAPQKLLDYYEQHLVFRKTDANDW